MKQGNNMHTHSCPCKLLDGFMSSAKEKRTLSELRKEPGERWVKKLFIQIVVSSPLLFYLTGLITTTYYRQKEIL